MTRSRSTVVSYTPVQLSLLDFIDSVGGVMAQHTRNANVQALLARIERAARVWITSASQFAR